MREDIYADYNDIVINVYDLDAFISAETDGEFESHDFGSGAAIIVKSDGEGCMVDYEAVGTAFNAITDTVKIGIHKMPEQHEGYTTISMIATHYVKCTYKEIIDGAPVKQMTVAEFFTKKNYNSRCQDNFRGILEYLEG